MNKHDKTLFNMLLQNKKDYKIIIDNDCVWLEKDGRLVGDFEEYGYHLLHDIFNYLGLDADYC